VLETAIQLTCDGCGMTEVWHEMNVPKYKVRAALKKAGWQSFGTLDYCPECVKNGNAKRRETDMNH